MQSDARLKWVVRGLIGLSLALWIGSIFLPAFHVNTTRWADCEAGTAFVEAPADEVWTGFQILLTGPFAVLGGLRFARDLAWPISAGLTIGWYSNLLVWLPLLLRRTIDLDKLGRFLSLGCSAFVLACVVSPVFSIQSMCMAEDEGIVKASVVQHLGWGYLLWGTSLVLLLVAAWLPLQKNIATK